MAINCRLREPVPLGTSAYAQLTDLINNEILFDVRVRKSDLTRLLDLAHMDKYGEWKCECELITTARAGADGGGVFVSEATLGMPSLWENIVEQQRNHVENPPTPTLTAQADDKFVQDVIKNIKIEPIEHQNLATIKSSNKNDTNDVVITSSSMTTCSQQANNVFVF